LTRVRGAEQMILRLYFSESSSGPGAPGLGSGSGTAYLRRLAGADIPLLAAIRAALARLRIVRGERVELQQTSLSVYHLISRGDSRRYSSAVFEATSRESGVAAIVSGPWPPYAFAPDLIE
ncbi:MAG: GvpL/GvpF family gas vesicle protein, partial [Vicinamibacterales bacterium]